MSEVAEVKTEEVPNGGRLYIMIAVGQNNELNVQGSINDKILAYGLLESARDAINLHIEQLRAPNIRKPDGQFMNFLRNGKHR